MASAWVAPPGALAPGPFSGLQVQPVPEGKLEKSEKLYCLARCATQSESNPVGWPARPFRRLPATAAGSPRPQEPACPTDPAAARAPRPESLNPAGRSRSSDPPAGSADTSP